MEYFSTRDTAPRLTASESISRGLAPDGGLFVPDTLPQIGEAELAALDRRFRLLQEHLEEQPEVRLTRFRPDERKSGGAYETVSGIVKQIDSIARRIRLLDGTDIPMDDVLTLDGALFDVLD